VQAFPLTYGEGFRLERAREFMGKGLHANVGEVSMLLAIVA